VSVLPADVVAWEKNIITTAITPNDTAHLLQINGHTSPAFAWSIGMGAKIDTLHYTQGPSSSVDGAISLMLDTIQTAARANYAIGFNETHVIPDINPTRTADDVRSEAWEFAFYTGGLYDGYSTNFSDTEATNASAQLGNLASVLRPPIVSGGYPGNISNLAFMQQSNCLGGTADWCQGIKLWASGDVGIGCPGGGANIYWSTMQSPQSPYDKALYIHHGVNRSQLSGQNGQAAYSAIACGGGQSTGYHTTTLQYRVPQVGCWAEVWRDPRTLAILAAKFRYLDHANQWYSTFNAPYYTQDVFFLVSLYNLGACPF
jgi:hypothetical protein